MPFDVWMLHSQPAYWGKRSKAELRARTLLGALEALRHGITTIQDMNSLVPQDEETLDTILSAYDEVGIRVVFSIAVRDLAALDIEPFLPPGIPPDVAALINGKPGDPKADIAFLRAQLARRNPLPPRLHWAIGPSGPQRCSTELLEGLAAISADFDLPVLTHTYETRAQLAKARTSTTNSVAPMCATCARSACSRIARRWRTAFICRGRRSTNWPGSAPAWCITRSPT